MSFWKRWVLPIVIAVFVSVVVSLIVVTLTKDDDDTTAPASTSSSTSSSTRVAPTPTRDRWLVVVGDGGAILASPEARTWREVRAEDGLALSGIARGRKRWVAVGTRNGAGVAVTTTNRGRTWSDPVTVPDRLHAVTYGDGRFLAVGPDGEADETRGGGVIYSSPDGRAWARVATTVPDEELLAFNHSLVSVAYGNRQWVALATESIGARAPVVALFTSDDGSSWRRVDDATYANTTFGASLTGQVAFGDGVWIVATPRIAGRGPDGVTIVLQPGLARSTDLVTWETITSAQFDDDPLVAIGASGTGWLLASGRASPAGSELFFSGDGFDWLPAPDVDRTVRAIAFAG